MTKLKRKPGAAALKEAPVPRVSGTAAATGKLRPIGGSGSDDFNRVIADQAVRSLWLAYADKEGRDKLQSAALATLVSIAPKDEIEGMLAAQMVAAHAASMECFRRAMISEQSHEGRQSNLNHAGKLSRTYVQLLEALNRHRGKGTQQKVTVEHVHVHAGGQAVVGTVEALPGGGGVADQNQRQPHAKALLHAPVAPLRGENTERDPVRLAGDAERSVSHARRKVARRSEG